MTLRDDLDPFLDSEAVQHALSIGRDKFHELIKTGRLKSAKLDGRRVVRRSEVDRFQREIEAA